MKDLIKGKNLKAYDLIKLLKEKCKNFTYKAPINLEEILKCLDVKLEKIIEWNDVLGEIEVKNEQVVIKINEANHLFEERERFTIAHELGHLCRHIAPNVKDKFVDTEETMKRNNYWSMEEYEANNFAAQLLMPDDLIVEEGKKIALQLKENGQVDINEFIFKMAQKFNVSKQAMRYRLKNLGII
jgi:Zn-dependent peptidase ImmA (M78 family)